MNTNVLMLGIVSGLGFAAIFALIALGLTMVLAATGVFNFAQGTVVMGGTIMAYIFLAQLRWPVALAVAVSLLIGVVAGLLTHLIAVWPAIGRSHSLAHTTVLTTIGLGTGADAVALLLFGGDSWPVPSFVSDSPVRLGSLPVRPIYIVMVAAGVTITFVIERLIRSTAIGHVFRATLEDPEGARIMGVDTRKVTAAAFGAAGALAAIAGFLAAPVIQASVFSAHDLAFFGFAGMAIGGFGSFSGALLGGVIVGLIYGMVPVLLNAYLTVPVMWMTVVAVLLVRPSGLLGAAGLFGSARLREI